MKKTLLILASFFLIFTADLYSQTELQIQDIEMINLGDGRLFGRMNDEAKTPLNGKSRIITGYTTEYIDAEFKDGYAVGKWEYYKQNKLENSQEFIDGFMDGKNIAYYSDGKTLKSTSSYSKGVLNGEVITYYSDGKTVESVTPFSEGEVVGIAVKYYPDGKKESEKGMKNRVEDGPDRKYDENGNIKAETIYKNGKPDGKSFANITSNTGDYLRTSFYKDGLPEGEYSEVFTDGTIKIKGKYKNGKKEGEWIANKQDGKKQPTEVYKDGDLVKKITYFTNDNVEIEKEMKNGKAHGKTKQYTSDGTLKSEKNYENGKEVGSQMRLVSSNTGNFYEYTTYDSSARKDGPYSQVNAKDNKSKVTGLYQKGQKHGKWIYYTDGKPAKEENYDNGKLVDSKTL